MLEPSAFFDLDGVTHRRLFDGRAHVWDALPGLAAYLDAWLAEHGARLLGSVAPGAFVGPDVHVAEGAVVEAGAYIAGPAVIGPHSEVRHGAYIAGTVLVGAGCVVGHATELKRSVLLDGAMAPHFAYVGDSILGRRVNLGAGTILSNLPMPSLADALAGRAPAIRIVVEGTAYDTGLGKFGAILGDDAQTGCNTVTNPGCLIGPRTLTYPGVVLGKGYHPADRIIKLRQGHVVVDRRRYARHAPDHQVVHRQHPPVGVEHLARLVRLRDHVRDLHRREQPAALQVRRYHRIDRRGRQQSRCGAEGHHRDRGRIVRPARDLDTQFGRLRHAR